MATSPPYHGAGSPPGSSIGLPKKRPSLGAPNASNKRRKQSAAGPSHLRQTSFPPENIPNRGSRSPSVDSNIVGTPSMMSGASGLKKKRRKNAKGGGDDEGSITGSAITKGRSGMGTAAGGSIVNGADADEDGDDEDDADGENGGAVAEGGQMDEAAKQQHKKNMEILFDAFTPDQEERYEKFRRVRLRKESVRKLTNHTVSQSVPANIITAIGGIAKSFVGDLVDRALDVQIEWLAATTETWEGGPVAHDPAVKARIEQKNRGPLTPDHIREALRRYKKDNEGASAGFLGLSLEANGRENVAAKTGRKKLFR
ncbi:hypothetical protein EG328_001852 [Venturia inaequalis]|uniref:TAFII28-like protein domain-containing protein n=1 Tax=Venturia inaequalis TaxID=5025 RepID=A0A8H3YXJ4_VENIN|nr:hypothetical protein EG328_001852 [Venturia inaequalis]